MEATPVRLHQLVARLVVPEGRADDERAAMARTAFFLLTTAATLELVSLALPGNRGRDGLASVLLAVSTYALAGGLLAVFDRLPVLACQAFAAGGTALVSAGVAFGGHGAVALSLFYFWLVLFVGYFFTPRQAVLQLAMLVLAYALVLVVARPPELTAVKWMLTTGTLTVAGAVAIYLRSRVVLGAQRAQASGERLRALIEASPAAIVELDRSGRVELWNRTAERMFGWLAPETVGKPPPVPAEAEAEHTRLVERAVTAGFAQGELRFLRRDGQAVDVAVAVAPVRDASGAVTGTMEIVSDVSERKRLEDDLRQAQRMEALGRLAGGIAHDFNNILLAIKSQAWLLLDSLPEDAAERQTVESLERAAERAGALTKQLLAFSRRQVLQPQLIDLNATVSGLDDMLRRLIGEDVELVTTLDPDLGSVRADPSQIEQVLVNLVINARDAMPGGGRLTIETRSLERALGYAVLSVMDTGTGIPPEVRPYIFEPFFTTKEGHGTGLGLATVHGIVRQSRGHLEVVSEPGRGSTFSVYLPSGGEPAAPLETPAPAQVVGGRETVLLVEDEEIVRDPMRRILEQQGYRVLEAGEGGEALELAAGHEGPIDVLLTDVVMPGLNGAELAQQLLEERPSVSVVYMSGYVDRSAELLEGDATLLQKPFGPEALTRAIQSALERNRMPTS